MRPLNILLGLVMVAFVVVQYNDPDGPLWAFYYAVPAAWAFIVALRPQVLRAPATKGLLWASVAVWFGLMVFHWPQMPNFWRKDVWWVEETAREGMGMMIAWVVVVVAALSARRHLVAA
jgi:Transmembrane family 220, helix